MITLRLVSPIGNSKSLANAISRDRMINFSSLVFSNFLGPASIFTCTTQDRTIHIGNLKGIQSNFLIEFFRHHHKRDHSRHAAAASADGLEVNGDDLNAEERQKRYEEKEAKREKKSRRHRSSMLEGTLPLTEDNFKNFATTEMERGLLETLMATSDSSTLKRNKERRKSVKERRSGSRTHEIKRSRTRENNVLEDLENNPTEENNY